MWTEITRPKYEREGLRYASDLTDGEWELIEFFMPPANAVGRPRTTDLCEVVNAILYLLRAARPYFAPTLAAIQRQACPTEWTGQPVICCG